MAAAPRLSLAWQNLSKGLPLRAVIFDARSLLRLPGEPSGAPKSNVSVALRNPEQLVATGNVKEMLQKEIREALKERGSDPVGKRWELEVRLEALLAVEREEAAIRSKHVSPGESDVKAASETVVTALSSSQAEAKLVPSPTGTDVEARTTEATSALSVRAKYADKLRNRAGVSLTSSGGLASTTDRHRTIPAYQRPDSSWHMQPGVRNLLTYLDMRGMLRGVLPSHDDKVNDRDGEEEARQLARALQVPPFGLVLGVDDTAALRGGAPAAVVAACASLQRARRRVAREACRRC